MIGGPLTTWMCGCLYCLHSNYNCTPNSEYARDPRKQKKLKDDPARADEPDPLPTSLPVLRRLFPKCSQRTLQTLANVDEGKINYELLLMLLQKIGACMAVLQIQCGDRA